MVTKVVRVNVCDACGSNETARYRITRQTGRSRTVTVDLCEQHAEGVEEAMAAKPVAHRKKRTVTPIEEVTARKKKPAKKKS